MKTHMDTALGEREFLFHVLNGNTPKTESTRKRNLKMNLNSMKEQAGTIMNQIVDTLIAAAIAGAGVFCCFILAPIVLAMAFMFFFHLGGGDN